MQNLAMLLSSRWNSFLFLVYFLIDEKKSCQNVEENACRSVRRCAPCLHPCRAKAEPLRDAPSESSLRAKKRPATSDRPCNRFQDFMLFPCQDRSELVRAGIAEDAADLFLRLRLDVVRDIGLREKERRSDGGGIIGIS